MKPDQPLVSVVTPVYNSREYLAECMESVLAQTHEHWEYVVMDNCSTDGSLELAREFEARDGRVTRIHGIANPAKLTHVATGLVGPAAATDSAD